MSKVPQNMAIPPTSIIELQRRLGELETENAKLKQLVSELTINGQNSSSFFNTTDHLLFVLDLQGNILLPNDMVIRRLGYAREELFGQNILMFYPPEYREEARHMVTETRDDKTNYCLIPLLTRDGRQIPVETRMSCGKWDGQEVIFGISKDITVVKSSEEKFSKAFHACPAPMAISEIESGKYIDVNEAFLDIFEFTRDELIGKTSLEMHLFDNSTQRTKLIQKLAANRHLRNEEITLYSKSGKAHRGLFSAEYINLQDGPYLLTVMNDITERLAAEEALRESEAQNRALFEQSHDAVFILSLQGQHLKVNQRAAEMLGYTIEELRGLSVQDISAELNQSLNVLEKLLADERIPPFERLFRKKNGEIVPVEINVEVVRNVDKQPIYIQSVVRDITQRKEAEEALRIAEARWQFALEGAGQGVWDWDIQSNHVFYSKQWKAMLGYAEDEIGNSHDEWEQRVHPDDLLYVKSEVAAYLNQQTNTYTCEYRIRCKNDEYTWVLDRGRIIEWTADGKPARMIGTHADISERIRSERNLRENEMRYRIVAENTHDWAFWQSPNGEFLYSSPSCLQVTGHEAVEFLQDDNLLLRIIDDEDRDLYLAHMNEVAETQKSSECEFRIEMPDGSVRWINHVCLPIFDSFGNYLGTRGSNRDVTTRKRTAMALEQANKQLRRQLQEIEDLEKELREQAVHDPLTGLYNRRYMQDFFAREFSRATRENYTLNVIMVDLDNLKLFNDKYGHDIGDKAILTLAICIRELIRAEDVACRYGGDEFIVVMSKASPEDVFKRVEEWRAFLDARPIEVDEKVSLRVKFTAGIASFPTHGNSMEEVTKCADLALYRAKERGRNCTVIFKPQ